jgi:excisionase family DNA binding protein
MAARYLTVPEAAEYLGMTPNAVRMMVQKRDIPHIRVGRRVRFDIRDLDAHMRARRIEATR